MSESTLVWMAHLMPAYLVGSIPFGFLFGKMKGIDIRKQGSGNIGATNVWRVMGKAWGIPTFLLDFLKVPAGWWMGELLKPATVQLPEIMLGVFFLGVIGHNYPVWLGFKGGKGIATSAGGLLWLIPYGFLTVLAVWGVVFGISRIVSLASIVAAAVLPFAVWFFNPDDKTKIGFVTVLCLLAIWRHRTNIQKLLKGEEHSFKRKKMDPVVEQKEMT